MTLLPDKAPRIFKATTSNPNVTIETPTARLFASLVGRGRFSNVFLSKSTGTVYIYSFFDDFSKSIMAHAYAEMRGRSKHLVQVERLGRITYRKYRVNVYKSLYYSQVTPNTILTQYSENLLEELQEAHRRACDRYYGNIIKTRNADKFNRYLIDQINPDVWPSMHAALTSLADCANDWGDHYIFDNFRRANVAIDEKGTLKLIDPMFDLEKIQADFDARKTPSRVMPRP